MARGSLPLTQFTSPDGSALSYGYILIELDTDANADGTQVCANSPVRVALDASGSVVGSPTFPTNSSMLPNTTSYRLRAYSSVGNLVYDYTPFYV